MFLYWKHSSKSLFLHCSSNEGMHWAKNGCLLTKPLSQSQAIDILKLFIPPVVYRTQWRSIEKLPDSWDVKRIVNLNDSGTSHLIWNAWKKPWGFWLSTDWKTAQDYLMYFYNQEVSTIEETITYIEGWLQRDTPWIKNCFIHWSASV